LLFCIADWQIYRVEYRVVYRVEYGITSTKCHINTVVPLDDRPEGARNMYRLKKYTKNKLCTKLVLFTRLYRDARSTKYKI